MPYFFFRNVYGQWCWEERNPDQTVVRESECQFDSREACEADAKQNGWDGKQAE